jgi:hypothetical protein
MSKVKQMGTVIDPQKPLMVRSWRRTRLPYDVMAKALEAGNAYFVGGLKRQTAHEATKSLSKRLGTKVTAVSAMYDEEKGYAFFKGSLEEWVKRTKTPFKTIEDET